MKIILFFLILLILCVGCASSSPPKTYRYKITYDTGNTEILEMISCYALESRSGKGLVVSCTDSNYREFKAVAIRFEELPDEE